MRRILTNILRNFNYARDYLLLAGDPVGILMAGVVLATQDTRAVVFNTLKWDRENKDYYVVPVSV